MSAAFFIVTERKPEQTGHNCERKAIAKISEKNAGEALQGCWCQADLRLREHGSKRVG